MVNHCSICHSRGVVKGVDRGYVGSCEKSGCPNYVRSGKKHPVFPNREQAAAFWNSRNPEWHPKPGRFHWII